MDHLPSSPSCYLSLVLLLVAAVSSEVTGDLSCSYDTFATLSCTWRHDTSRSDAACILKAQVEDDSDIHGSCSLTVNGVNSSSCHLFLDKDRKAAVLTIGHTMHLLLKCCSGNQSYFVQNLPFIPYENVKLNPPHSLQVKNLSDAGVNLTWTCEDHYYVHGKRIYAVRYRPVGESWQYLDIMQEQMWVEMPALGQDDLYEVQVRVSQRKYSGRWSDWSNALEWRTPPAALPLAIGRDLEQSLRRFLFLGGICTAGVFIAVALLTFVCRKTYWLKRQFCPSVPDPSKFFEPLLTLHGGELKLSFSSPFPPSSFSHVDSASKISPVDVVTRKDQEQVLLRVYPCLTTPYENSGHSQCSFHNLGYFQSQGTFERDQCHVYFTDEPLDIAKSAILADTSYQALSSVDSSLLCGLHPHQPPDIDKDCIKKESFMLTCNSYTPEEHSQLLLSQAHHVAECEKSEGSVPLRSTSKSNASTQDLAKHQPLPRVEPGLKVGNNTFSQCSGDAFALLPPAYVNILGHASAQRLGVDTDEYLTLKDLQLQYGSNMTVAGLC